MQSAMRTFAMDDRSVSGLLYNLILGKSQDTSTSIRVNLPPVPKGGGLSEQLQAPGLVRLNQSQANVVRKALQSPLCLVQGPPGTGKTATAASLVYHMTKQHQGQVLVCAPSNIAVEQLAGRIHLTGLKVVRICSKSREGIPRCDDEHIFPT